MHSRRVGRRRSSGSAGAFSKPAGWVAECALPPEHAVEVERQTNLSPEVLFVDQLGAIGPGDRDRHSQCAVDRNCELTLHHA
jgi:hypothetical protein